MDKKVITIGCEFGAGGPQIGKMLSETLGIEYYDRDLVDKIAHQLGVDKELVEKADTEKRVQYEFETTLGPRYANLTNKVIYLQQQAIEKMAERPCVIIGRSANYILQDRKDVLNLFIYAPKETRVRSVMEQLGVDRGKALDMIDSNDIQLHERHKYITGTYRGDRHGRDLLIDSSMLGWEGTAKYILMLIEMLHEK
ncbi:cytidylate kinase-like family protein [Bilifractor porci]|jgi:cytidylate kinase|uniref:Cytidylate kinase-like family protein n=1 Tax=Bilifractor porci TaxID=2606636 RepID=A0A7X2TNL8_9FIRM|nr:cytidylate kinase-like family protein [Bilifractor porci]MST81685.1 cytidylate kinase-like family protein [Bilifractor porci]